MMLQCKLPNVGEQIAEGYLRSKGFDVISVQDNRYYQQQDIDFIIAKGEEVFSIECKYDNYLFYTHTAFIEYNHIFIDGIYEGTTRTGWGNIEGGSNADFLFYVEPKEKTIYIAKMIEIQEYVAKHKSEMKSKQTNKDGYKITQGYILDWNLFAEEYYLRVVQA